MGWLLDSLSYIRGLFITPFIGLWTLFWSAVTVIAVSLTRSRRVADLICVDIWSRSLLWLAGVSLEIRGREHAVDSKKGFLILFNHSSLFDIPVLFLFPRSFRFGAKAELFKIPFFGKAMEICGVLPIDRGNREKVMKVYENAIRRVENGESFALAPEGTRQFEPRIGSFKRGPFEFAINAQMDIVPVVLNGVFEVMPKKTLWINMGRWRRHVVMEILPRISTQGLTLQDLDGLILKTREQFEATFAKNRGNYGHANKN